MFNPDKSSISKTPRNLGLLKSILKLLFGAKKKSAHLVKPDTETVKELPIIVARVYEGNPFVLLQQGDKFFEARKHVSTYLPGNSLALGDEVDIISYDLGNHPVVQKKGSMSFNVDKSTAKIIAPEVWLPKQRVV